MIFYQDEAVTLHHGDTLATLRTLPDESVNCCVTSPPYYGLRDYGHAGQYGLESSPTAYVDNMRAVFAEVRRVLAKDGTLWLNLGDSYVGNPNSGSASLNRKSCDGKHAAGAAVRIEGLPIKGAGLPSKNLLGIPWRTAFALQDDDSGDVYELLSDAPESVRSVIYLETCHTKTPKQDGPITASTQSVGEKPTPSDTPNGEQCGTKPTETRSADTVGSTTSSTASRRSFGKSEETLGDTADSDLQHYSTTAERTPPAPAAENGTFPSSHSTTSTAEETSTEKHSAKQGSTRGSSCGERDTPRGTESSATTATQRAATTDRARTKMRLRKAQIRPEWLQYFRMVKQDRWILRNCVVWSKPNAMPESVTDRLSSRHELLFMFSRSRKYWFDLDPIREDHSPVSIARSQRRSLDVDRQRGFPGAAQTLKPAQLVHDGGRNPGDVWTIPTTPFPGAHFAVFPPEIPRRCILAGCKPGGTVLDPFSGSGTTGMVAGQLGRKYVGIDLSADYLRLSLETRLAQTALLDGESA